MSGTNKNYPLTVILFLSVWIAFGIVGAITQPVVGYAVESDSSDEFGVNATPQVKPYTINSDLSDVSNLKDFRTCWVDINDKGEEERTYSEILSDKEKAMLAKNGFFACQRWGEALIGSEFFELYEENRYNLIPNFVTTDSILHNYHLYFDYILRKLEEEKLAVELKKLNLSMLVLSQEQYKHFKGTEWENAAKRNVAFFAVGGKLLDSSVVAPDFVKKEVDKELALIKARAGMDISPVMNMGAPVNPLESYKEDYSQYIPRGHYTKSETLKAYFKSMMWYGRMNFRLKNDDEIKSAALMASALRGDSYKEWENIFEPISFFVGRSDDINIYQVKEACDQVYGKDFSWKYFADDSYRFYSFIASLKKTEPPQINSMPIFNAELQPDREKEIKGFRFMGQRFTIDASIFQRLVYREVEDRMLPKGLDIPAAMGSKEALNILESMGETKYPSYMENMNKMRETIAGFDKGVWTQNLYWGWLYTLLPLTVEKPEGYPSFMQSIAWTRKDLNTYLGSWTELKHDTILYAKQCYAEGGGDGEEIIEKDDRGYVEPNVDVYARLALLTDMTIKGLDQRGLLSEKNRSNLEILKKLSLELKTISEKELENKSLTLGEFELIRSYGEQLEHFWLEVNKEEMESQKLERYYYLQDNPAAIVADVATAGNTVLEEGTGYIYTIYAIVPVEGKLKIVSGGVYTYYEFEWPASDRLTDKKWRTEVMHNTKLPEWTSVYVLPRKTE